MEEAFKVETTANEIASLLDRSNWLPSFTWKQQLIIASHFELYKFESEIVIVSEGIRDPKLGVIISGVAKVLKKGDDGEMHEIAELKKHRTFGEMSLIDGCASSAQVKTCGTQPFEVLVLTEENFEQLLDETPKLAAKIIQKIGKELSTKLRRTTGILLDHL